MVHRAWLTLGCGMAGQKLYPYPLPCTWGGGGGARGCGFGLFAFGGAYWPLATARSDPLWVRTCFGRVNGAPDDLSCLTTPGVGRPGRPRDGAVARRQVHPDAHSESMPGLPTPALTCARWGVQLRDDFPDRGFSQPKLFFPFCRPGGGGGGGGKARVVVVAGGGGSNSAEGTRIPPPPGH